ncbi:XF1762 family protein [Sphingomonas aerolata]|uniref:XF1762 family protein n=1 Tax=Sphingomonas aerolata TaxID=185951 RepID=UPI002FE02D87
MITPRPVQRIEVRQFVLDHHRHQRWVSGFLWLHGLAGEGGALVGIAVVGRPGAGARQDGVTKEVARLCTDGEPNGCSMLYGAARRAATAKGDRRGLTYILASEPGASLRAAGWRFL